MAGPGPLTVWIGLITIALQSSYSDSECTSFISQLTATSKSLISVSSVRDDLKDTFIDCIKVDRCEDAFQLRGWCPESESTDNWVEISFQSVINVTCLTLQKPYTLEEEVPTINQIKIYYEPFDDKYGSLVLYNPSNESGAGIFNLTYSNETKKFDLDLTSVFARRVRIEVVNYTTAACLRLDIRGLPLDVAPLTPAEPRISLDFTSVNDMSLKCQLMDGENYDVQHWLAWYKNGVIVSSQLLNSRIRQASLNVTVADFFSQATHHCEIWACYGPFCSDGENGTYSIRTKSNQYIPGLRIPGETSLHLSEGKVTEVKVVLTAPPALLCALKGLSVMCDVRVAVTATDTTPLRCSRDQQVLPQLLFPADQCSITVSMSTWQNVRTFQVTPNSGTGLSGLRYSTLTFTYSLDGDFQDKSVISLQINTTFNGHDAVCESHSIANIQTFDGRRYDNYVEGELVLYQHKSLPYEIRTFWKSCVNNSAARCQCAVAVRVKDDVILLRGCMDKQRMVVNLYKGSGVSEQFSVRSYSGGLQYEVTLPSGGRVVAEETYKGSINVWYYASLADYNSTVGLCGSYDSDESNDLMRVDTQQLTTDVNAFITSWRIDPTQSYYNGRCATVQDVPSGIFTHFTQCQSTDNDGDVSILNAHLTCSMLPEFDLSNDMTNFLKSTQTSPGNCVEGDNLGNLFEYNTTASDSDEPDLYPDNWNTTSARAVCETAVNTSSVAEKCSTTTLSNEDIINCMNDIKLTGDIAWTRAYVEVLEQRCRQSFGQLGPPNVVLNGMCPNDCSSHGTCFGGTCTCDQGFDGADCAYNTSIAPNLVRLGSPLCNNLVSTCDSVMVFGYSFLDNEDLTCYVQTIEVNSSNFSTSVVTPASKTTFVSSSQVKCEMPAGNYIIYVANSENLLSNGLPFVTFNPECFICSENGTCKKKVSKDNWRGNSSEIQENRKK